MTDYSLSPGMMYTLWKRFSIGKWFFIIFGILQFGYQYCYKKETGKACMFLEKCYKMCMLHVSQIFYYKNVGFITKIKCAYK